MSLRRSYWSVVGSGPSTLRRQTAESSPSPRGLCFDDPRVQRGYRFTCGCTPSVHHTGQKLGLWAHVEEEVQEVEQAVTSGALPDVLAELVDILYLAFNLLQECGLEQAIEPAFMMKHGDNMKKQHATVAHLNGHGRCILSRVGQPTEHTV